MSLTTLPPELLESILDLIDVREDLFSLALSARLFTNTIIPTRLEYHTLVATPYHAALWENLCGHPERAKLVHNLTLHDNPRQPQPDRGKSRLRVPRGLDALADPYATRDPAPLARALRGMVNARTLHLVYSRYSGTAALPDTLRLAFANLLSLERVSATMFLNLEARAALAECSHPMWALSGLKTLELDFGECNLPHALCTPFEAIVRRSPDLEALRLPDFLSESGMRALCSLPLPRLTRFAHGSVRGIELPPLIASFLESHPTITSVQWEKHGYAAPIAAGALPALQHLSVPGILWEELPHEPHTLHLVSLTGVWFYPELLPKLFRLLDGPALRVLHIDHLDKLNVLRNLARACPNVRELRLPECSADRENVRIGARLMRALLRPWVLRVTLGQVMEMWSGLEVVSGVRGPAALAPERKEDDKSAVAALEELRGAYPTLRRVNGWRVR